MSLLLLIILIITLEHHHETPLPQQWQIPQAVQKDCLPGAQEEFRSRTDARRYPVVTSCPATIPSLPGELGM